MLECCFASPLAALALLLATPSLAQATRVVLLLCALWVGGVGQGASARSFPSSVDLSTLNGANGFVLNGIDPGDNLGRSVSAAVDVNGDGLADLLISAPAADPNGQEGAGESYVVFGGPTLGAGGVLDLSTLDGANGFAQNGIDYFDLSGISVSSPWDTGMIPAPETSVVWMLFVGSIGLAGLSVQRRGVK